MISFNFLYHPLFRLLLPIIFIGCVIIGMDSIIGLFSENQGFSYKLPYAIFFFVLLLSQPFNQGRIGMISISMAIAYWIIQQRLQAPLLYGNTRIEFILIAFLLPICITTPFIFPDRRTFSKYTAIYLTVLLILYLWGSSVISYLSYHDMSPIWQTYLATVQSISPLPIVIVIYSFIVCCLSAFFVVNNGNSSDQASYTCLLFSALTFTLFGVDFISSILFSIAGLLLLLYIIFDSHQLAFKDQLTGIAGRRSLESEMAHLGRRYTIAMLDVDHFKKFNDTYGHDTGDNVLKLVASLMLKTGGNAKIYRYGGEEFTVLFKGKTTQQSLKHLEQLRENIANYDLVIRQSSTYFENTQQEKNQSKIVNVTISIGVADNSEFKNPQEVIKESDNALYRAKNAGRNCVCL